MAFDRGTILPLIAEVFREQGWDGASLSLIGQRTGLGKGSLYNLFPGGKAEMAEAVIDQIAQWFEAEIFAPLDSDGGVPAMLTGIDAYFHGGERVCLIGVLALVGARDLFADRISAYFARWVTTLAAALVRAGHAPAAAHDLAEETVAAIQGALVLARAFREPALFSRCLDRLRHRLEAAASER